MALLDLERPTRAGAGKDSALRDWLGALEATAPIGGRPERTLPRVIEEMAQHHGETDALISARGTLTYHALAERANRYARWALDQKVAQGETVCLLMPNRPEYFAIWLGITSVGGVVSLLNTQLRGPSLAHCIDIVKPKHVIVAAELATQFRSATLSTRPKIWWHGGRELPRINCEIERFSGAPLAQAERRAVTIADRALTIYTSGTTGMPKAANVSHRRLMQWSFWFAGLMNTTPDDRMYNCLPMYHAVGGVAAIGALLVRGGSVVDRREIFGSRVLERYRRLGLHAVPIYRRVVPLSGQCAGASVGAQASAAYRLRQRLARRRVGEIPVAFCHSANPGILRGDRG